ncbi:MAG: hypothetical protein EPO32_04900 [Anaerolineae bacterium]|nr:MAG: hypothetical protein EPO32_04900 [Anaerolineae bacterium]
MRSPRAIAILEGLAATLIWASSYVLVKILVADIGPLTLAGLRYFLGFLLLLPFLRRGRGVQGISRRTWLDLSLAGLAAYTVGNGAMYAGLKHLSPTTVTFLVGIVPLFILFLGIFFLKEVPTWIQVVGVFVTLGGNAVYFINGLDAGEPLGIAWVALGVVGFTAFGILGRKVAKARSAGTLALTTIPLGVGGAVTLALALPLEGVPVLTPQAVGILFWLAAVNTALAYLLYNHALKTITALEMNVLLNLSPLATALLSFWMLGDRATPAELLGIGLMIFGVSLVQVRKSGSAVVAEV